MLDDCRQVVVRRLRADDRGRYEAAVARLSSRSRYLRFAAPIPRVSSSLLDQMMDADDTRHVVYVALAPGEQTIVGVSRFVATGAPGVAEVALAVADDWQGHGLGFELLCWVIAHAHSVELECLTATTLRENQGAARLARAGGFSVSAREGIYTDYEMSLREVARSSGGRRTAT